MIYALRRYRKTLSQDLIAGATGAAAGAPQAMGFALVAGVNPIYGLYTAIVSTFIGTLAGSSVYMTVGPTNALALVVGSTLLPFDQVGQIERLFVLTALVGVFQLSFAMLQLGSLTRFVSNAVMTGFITGAGLLIILGQIDNLTGTSTSGDSVPGRFINWLTNPQGIDPATVFVGLLTIVLIYGAQRMQRLKNLAALIALLLTSGLVALAGWQSVAVVGDVSSIVPGLPLPVLPDLGLVPDLALVGLALAVLASVQGAAISSSVPQPDGTTSKANRDLFGQGLANIVGSFFQGMPACGSLSRTAVNVSAGARTRMANLLSAVFIAVIVIALGGLVEQIAMPALAGLLIVAAISLIRLDALRLVWRVNLSGRLAMVITFVSTLVLPLEYSIYVGVALSLSLYVYSSSQTITVTRLVPLPNGHFLEAPVPSRLPDAEPVILCVRGSLYFAAVHRLEELMPLPRDSRQPVVVLRMRGNQYLGSTGIRFLRHYAAQLRSHGGDLILSGISDKVRAEIERTGALGEPGPIRIFYAEDEIFHATEDAVAYAKRWLSNGTHSAETVETPAAQPQTG